MKRIRDFETLGELLDLMYEWNEILKEINNILCIVLVFFFCRLFWRIYNSMAIYVVYSHFRISPLK